MNKLTLLRDEINELFIKNNISVAEGQAVLSELFILSTIDYLKLLDNDVLSNKEKIKRFIEHCDLVQNYWISVIKDAYKE